jgi:hypothetical protein
MKIGDIYQDGGKTFEIVSITVNQEGQVTIVSKEIN